MTSHRTLNDGFVDTEKQEQLGSKLCLKKLARNCKAFQCKLGGSQALDGRKNLKQIPGNPWAIQFGCADFESEVGVIHFSSDFSQLLDDSRMDQGLRSHRLTDAGSDAGSSHVKGPKSQNNQLKMRNLDQCTSITGLMQLTYLCQGTKRRCKLFKACKCHSRPHGVAYFKLQGEADPRLPIRQA
jgi:hypothetical protein